MTDDITHNIAPDDNLGTVADRYYGSTDLAISLGRANGVTSARPGGKLRIPSVLYRQQSVGGEGGKTRIETTRHLRTCGCGVGRYIHVVEKVELAYPDWDGDAILNGLRAAGGYDGRLFQQLFGLPPARQIEMTHPLRDQDLARLESWISHSEEPGRTPRGVLTDCFGNGIALGHVLTGLSAGLHPNPAVDFAREELGLPNPAGETVDNLYAATIAGDLGQAAALRNANRVGKLVGPSDSSGRSEATPAELIGDIDGFMLGRTVASVGASLKIGKFLRDYYCDGRVKGNGRRFRRYWEIRNTTGEMERLIDQTTRFAENYSYHINKATAPFRTVGDLSRQAVGEFLAFAGAGMQEEERRAQA